MPRIALTCPNLLVDVLPGRVSGAACTTWAAGDAGGREGNAPIGSPAAVGAHAVSGRCCRHMTIGQANWGKKGWAGSLTGQGLFDELPVVKRALSSSSCLAGFGSER